MGNTLDALETSHPYSMQIEHAELLKQKSIRTQDIKQLLPKHQVLDITKLQALQV